MAPEQTLRRGTDRRGRRVRARHHRAGSCSPGCRCIAGPISRRSSRRSGTSDAPRIDALNPRVPTEIVDAIARALTRDPTRRGTAADLVVACARTAMQGGAHALAAWLEQLDESVPRATVVTPTMPARPSCRRRRRPPSGRLASQPIRPSQTRRSPTCRFRRAPSAKARPGSSLAIKRAATGFEGEPTTTASRRKTSTRAGVPAVRRSRPDRDGIGDAARADDTGRRVAAPDLGATSRRPQVSAGSPTPCPYAIRRSSIVVLDAGPAGAFAHVRRVRAGTRRRTVGGRGSTTTTPRSTSPPRASTSSSSSPNRRSPRPTPSSRATTRSMTISARSMLRTA